MKRVAWTVSATLAFVVYGACGGRTGLDVGVPPSTSTGTSTSSSTSSSTSTSSGASCDGGSVVGDVFGGVVYFAGGNPLPAGHYRVTYVDGCMKYSGSQGWTVQAVPNASWWSLVGATTGTTVAMPPGTVGYLVGAGAYANFDDCVAANLQLPPVDFDFAGGVLGLWLLDSPYSDNVAGLDGRNPTWQVNCD